MEITKTDNGRYFIIKDGLHIRQIRAKIINATDDPISDREELIIKLCDELIRVKEKENKRPYMFGYKEILEKPLKIILEDMKRLNANSTALKFCDENDKVMAGVFVVTGEAANDVANKIDFICEGKDNK